MNADVSLVANVSYIKATDTVTGYFVIDQQADGANVYANGDLSFTISDDGTDISFTAHPTPISGSDFYIEVAYMDGANKVASEIVSITSADTYTPSLPTGATSFSLGAVMLGVEMLRNADGEYEGTLAAGYLNDIQNVFTPFNVQVSGADGTVYAQDSALVGATYETAVGTLDYAAINALSDGSSFTTKVQVVDVPTATNLDILTEGTGGSIVSSSLNKGIFRVSEDDLIVLSVQNNTGDVITATASTGADTLDVHLSNAVDFLGVDINEDQDYVDAYETATNGVVGYDDGDTATGDDTISVYLDVSDASVGDVIELYVDGTLIATSASLTQTQIDSGALEMVNTSDSVSEFDLDSSNSDADDKVLLEVKVKNSSDVYVQENANVTWEYQW